MVCSGLEPRASDVEGWKVLVNPLSYDGPKSIFYNFRQAGRDTRRNIMKTLNSRSKASKIFIE